jgi:hypothetical protein
MGKNNGEKEPAQRNVQVFKEKQYLECMLSDDELKQASRELADACQRKTSIEDQLATFKAQKKAEITQCDGEINKNTVLVSSGKEMRMVECEATLDFDSGKRTVVRLDSGVIVQERPLSTDEKQLELNV